ncbi:MAG: hypothetical protein NTAFB05_01590 [Nitrobacter sp.]
MIIQKIAKPIYILDTEVHIAKGLSRMKENHATEVYFHVPPRTAENGFGFIGVQVASEASKGADFVRDAHIPIAQGAGIDTSAVEISQIVGGEAIRIGNFLEVLK